MCKYTVLLRHGLPLSEEQLLAFPGIWSSVDTTNRHHLKFYLARSKKVLLHVNYGHRIPPGTFEQYIIPERCRLQSLSIPLSDATHREVAQSLSGVAESLKALDLWTVFHTFPVPVTTMETITFPEHSGTAPS